MPYRIHTFADAVRYLHDHVPQGRTLRYPGQQGIVRAQALLAALDGPQNQMRVIHLAGTSGKGSTATFIASLLQAHGFSVGLHLSPHLLDIRERVQLNGELISQTAFTALTDRVAQAAASLSERDVGHPTYFELLVAVAFLAFAERRVDYAVIETGLGGTFDGTNVVDRSDKICVLTPIDIDHVRILGATRAENAIQKAGIIQGGNIVVVGAQPNDVSTVLKQRCASVGARLDVATPAREVVIGDRFTSCAWSGYHQLRLGLWGLVQADNAGLALSTVRAIAVRDRWHMTETAVRSGLNNAHLRGRFELSRLGKRTVIFDGAHNPQKMAGLVASLRAFQPGGRYDMLLSFREGKDVHSMLTNVSNVASSIVGTSFAGVQDSAIQSVSLKDLETGLMKLGVPFSLNADPRDALARLVATDGPPVVVTGSLYLLSELLPAVDDGLGKE